MTVTIEAGSAKNKQRAELPLKRELATELKELFAGTHPAAKAFGGTHNALTEDTAEIIRADLQAADLPYEDDAGRVFDFHALRGQCASLLAANNVHPKLAQEVLRHADINLTMNTYTHTLREHRATAMDSLPDLSAPPAEQQRRTGTDDRDVTDEILSSMFCLTSPEMAVSDDRDPA